MQYRPTLDMHLCDCCAWLSALEVAFSTYVVGDGREQSAAPLEQGYIMPYPSD